MEIAIVLVCGVLALAVIAGLAAYVSFILKDE